MKRSLARRSTWLVLGGGAAAAALLGGCRAEDATRAARPIVYATAAGQTLTAPSKAAPQVVVSRFLEQVGALRAAMELEIAREGYEPRTAITHLRLRQRANGLRVVGAYVKAAVNDRGELVHLVDRLAKGSDAAVVAAGGDESLALAAAFLHHGYPTDVLPAETRREAHTSFFRKGTFFHAAPRVERVAYATGGGALASGYLVETWTRRGNRLHQTLVSDAGAVVSVEGRTNTDRYNVFPLDPSKGAQTIVSGPGAGNAESPAGWLGAGAQLDVAISGNNTNTYLDRDGNNRADRGGTTVTGGDFLATASFTQAPTVAVNQAVAVQNLFYLNNVAHDTLYRHGFTEAAGNFQADNFGKGGSGGDAVNAEAQDGAGTDNANFATPPDGRAPRMQMFLWTGAGPTHQVHQTAPTAADYGAKGAEFGPALGAAGVSGVVAVANDGTGTTTDGCEALQANVSGKIALVDRGTCNFTVKVLNAQNAGALGVIVANNAATDVFTMGGTERRIRIPAVMVSQADGAALKATASPTVTLRAHPNAPLQVDASLDSDIVYHEYGHGLSWRMIGGMSGPLAGAIGEGCSDGVAMLINGDDVVAEYSASSATGIRRHPYADYPGTYASVTGAEVHDDGEIYGAIVWRLIEKFARARVSRDQLFDYYVGGMSYTPSTPAFEDMRDGMVQAAAVAGLGHECLVWEAFAEYGVGVGASGVASSSGVAITESFALPPECGRGGGKN